MNDETGIRRAAVIVEAEDGTRMVYAFDPGSPMSVTVKAKDAYLRWMPFPRLDPMPHTLTVEGTFAGGRIWKGPMPGEGVSRREIESRRAAIEGATA